MNADKVTTTKVPVSLEVVWQDSSQKYDARMSELDVTGGYIDCPHQANVGELFDFKMRLPSGHWVPFQAIVAADDYPSGFEFQFINLTDDKRKLINLVTDAAKKPVSPVRRTTDERSAINLSDAPPSHARKHRILIAEDDLMTLRMLSAIVETHNYEVVTAPDGRQAFRILQHDNNFTMAIFDMNMPHLDGLDLITYMKTDERLKQIPIGMITAETDPKIWDESLAAGADVFLPKPFSPPQVKMMIDILNRKKSTV